LSFEEPLLVALVVLLRPVRSLSLEAEVFRPLASAAVAPILGAVALDVAAPEVGSAFSPDAPSGLGLTEALPVFNLDATAPCAAALLLASVAFFSSSVLPAEAAVPTLDLTPAHLEAAAPPALAVPVCFFSAILALTAFYFSSNDYLFYSVVDILPEGG